ncbi:Uncharacterized protein APZ42_034160 [Daphnia magna]|uniref:Uncharacterized protein n=1 Tax=Daphnia magna TaxID=35525 RepID=A0A164KDV0_9CRUS|nr:Uncharacterized protein APZ42_034160 [Daphnia magna]
MPSQSFAAFTALLRLTTCILLCKPFIIFFMPSPHYELSSFICIYIQKTPSSSYHASVWD